MAEIKLDDEQINKALEGAIMNALGETGRVAIVKHAVDYLTREERGGYGVKRSPLLDVIYSAAREIADRVLHERLVNDPEFIAQVESLYADAAKKMFNVENRAKIVDKLSGVMADAISKDRY